MDIKFEIKKIKFKGKKCYQLIIHKNNDLYSKLFQSIEKLCIQNLFSKNSISSVYGLYMYYDYQQYYYIFSETRKEILNRKTEFLKNYSKITTVKSLSKHINLNEFKLHFKLKKYGLVDDNDLIFELEDLEDVKLYLMEYFNAIDMFNKLTI